jgi:hypothetical protein
VDGVRCGLDCRKEVGDADNDDCLELEHDNSLGYAALAIRKSSCHLAVLLQLHSSSAGPLQANLASTAVPARTSSTSRPKVKALSSALSRMRCGVSGQHTRTTLINDLLCHHQPG